MFGLGGGELLVIVLVALLVFGPKRIPEVARTIGQAYREFTRWRKRLDTTVSDLRQEIDLNIDEPEILKRPLLEPDPQSSPVPKNSRPATQNIEVAEWDDYLAPPSYEPGESAGVELTQAAATPDPAVDDYLAGEGS